MKTPGTHRRVPSPFPRRIALRLLTLAVAMVFILWAMSKASKPETWRWIAAFERPHAAHVEDAAAHSPTTESPSLAMQFAAGQAAGYVGQFTVPLASPASHDLGLLGVMGQEFVPLPAVEPGAGRPRRQAPVPSLELLKRARDRSDFLVESPDDPENETFGGDADARYHLIDLARDASVEALAADARHDVRFTALLEKPWLHRGEVIHVEGDLLWITRLELKRPVPQLEFVYQGIITGSRPDHPYYVLFTELPPHFPPERDWSALYLRNVQFDGYFLKVLRKDHPREQGKAMLFPVLVGRSPRIPPQATGYDFGVSLRALAILLGVVLVVGVVVTSWIRWQDRRHAARLAEARARARGHSPLPAENDHAPGDNGVLS